MRLHSDLSRSGVAYERAKKHGTHTMESELPSFPFVKEESAFPGLNNELCQLGDAHSEVIEATPAECPPNPSLHRTPLTLQQRS